MFVFYLIILEGILVSLYALETSRFKISLIIASSSTSDKEKAVCFFFAYFPYSEYARMFFFVF